MAIETTPWDPSEFLTNEEAITAYLEAAFEDGDPTFIAVALVNIAKAKGMTSVARDAGFTNEAFHKSLSEKGPPPNLSTLLDVMKALGLKFTVTSVTEAA
ncbi:addiction module antidote protein [Rhizobium sp.]